MKFAALSLALVLTTACSNQTDSELEATNEFEGKKVGHWYETFTLDSNADNSFIKYHQANKDILLGNRIEVLPETLKGLWFMDGNPVSDQSLNLSNVMPGRSNNEDFFFEVNTPATFSWINTKESHTTIALIQAVKLSYSFKFLDCPEDVRLERQNMWGMKDGSCSSEDKEFAIITPVIKSPFGEIRISSSIAYFDMYLRPKTDDFHVWERRSKVFEVGEKIVNRITSIFRRKTIESDFHRYKFTQILDKEGNELSSYNRFVDYVHSLAADNAKDQKDFIFYLCYNGATGCDRETIADGDILTIAPANFADFGAIPVF